MKYLILVFIISLGLSSCVTERICNEKFPQDINTRDSIVYKYVEVLIHDTTFIAGDTIVNSDTVFIDKTTGTITSNRLYSESEYAMAWAQIIDNKLFLELIQKDTAIARVLRENVQIVETHTETIKEVNKWIEHWYSKPAYILAGIFLVLIVGGLLLTVLKAYIKPF